MGKYVYAVATAAVGFDGGVIRLTRGQVWFANHPLVKQAPDFFSEEPPIVHGVVEDATAEPGKKRSTR
jgi:hypothetical protein